MAALPSQDKPGGAAGRGRVPACRTGGAGGTDDPARTGAGAARRSTGPALPGLDPGRAPVGAQQPQVTIVARFGDDAPVARWLDVELEQPAFAQRVRALFDAHRHKTISTLRADGSPRISGIETQFEDGELVFGSMSKARKGADLRRDPRFAVHSATVDPIEGAEAAWPGEAKIAGRAILQAAPEDGADGERFRADIVEVVHTHLNKAASLLVVEWWTPSRGLRRIERE